MDLVALCFESRSSSGFQRHIKHSGIAFDLVMILEYGLDSLIILDRVDPASHASARVALLICFPCDFVPKTK